MLTCAFSPCPLPQIFSPLNPTQTPSMPHFDILIILPHFDILIILPTTPPITGTT